MGKTNLSPLQRAAMKHNSLIGLAVAIRKNAFSIYEAPTATSQAKLLADGIYITAYQLEAALRAERKKP
jgi:hypothetical protein